MKTKKQVDSATVRKCFIDSQQPGIIRFTDGVDAFDGVLAGTRAPMIVQAVNSFDTLKAVAYAAREAVESGYSQGAHIKLTEALKQLA